MRQLKVDITKSIVDNVKSLLINGDTVLMEFEVVPLDYRVVDRDTPKLFITNLNLIFSYDSIIEVYDLASLTIDIIGKPPKFTLWQQLFEGKFAYSNYEEASLKKIKDAEYLCRLALNEPNLVPKEFVLRNKEFVAKPFQTWAMARKLLNHKNRLPADPVIDEMLKGYFTSFNTKTVLAFAIISLVFILLRWAISGLPDLIQTISDFVYGGLVVLMAVWFYITISRNLARFEKAYYYYSNDIATDKPNLPNTSPVETAVPVPTPPVPANT